MTRIVTHCYVLLLINRYFELLPLTRIFTGNNIVTGYYTVTVIVIVIVIVTMIVTIGVLFPLKLYFANVIMNGD